MAIRYSLQCPACAAIIEVTTIQAGQEIACTKCAETVTAPRLGDIKKLPLAEGQEVATEKSRANSPVKGWLFSIGLLLAAAAGIAAFSIHSYASAMSSAADEIGGSIEEYIDNQLKEIDEMSAADVYDIAVEADKESFRLEYREALPRTLSIQSSILMKVAYGFWALSGIGVTMLLSSFFVSQKK